MDHTKHRPVRGGRRPVRSRRRRTRRPMFVVTIALLLAAAAVVGGSAVAQSGRFSPQSFRRPPMPNFEFQSLDGTRNNRAHPEWGKAGTNYSRVAPANYADGHSAMVAGPNTRYVSNRVFNDTSQNIFSENRVTQWGFVWGQFLDHTIGLRDDVGETANVPFNSSDPLETFTNNLGVVPFIRSNAAPGTGVDNAREQVNTVSSYVDAWAVYGGAQERLEWLRAGPVDGNMRNNSAFLLLPDRYLPRRDSRGNATDAPTMAVDGRLMAQPDSAMVAGDVRANENIGLTATHTLFAREHNRIVSRLPRWLSEEQKFQIARRIVIAEQQWITYNEFLPALGIRLSPYRGYNSDVNATLSNEFATVGYRAHSMIHGELELETDADRYSADELEAFEEAGVEVATSEDGEEVELAVPLNVAFFNPNLVPALGLGPLLQGIGLEAEYQNDEQIDNQLRSVLFQVPSSDNPECLDGPGLPECFQGVVDLGALDVERGRDHGMPTYNDLRRAYGLAPKTSFRAITGEASEAFPSSPELTAGQEIDDPNSLDFMQLRGPNGEVIAPDSPEAEASVIRATRRTPLAARLKAIYGTVDKVDAFVGMVAERHVRRAEFGELQLAIWKRQFEALRDGDRFFYGNDPGLNMIRRTFNLDFRHTLAELIAANTDLRLSDLNSNVFLLAEEEEQQAPESASTSTPGRGNGTPTSLVPPATTASARNRGRRKVVRLDPRHRFTAPTR